MTQVNETDNDANASSISKQNEILLAAIRKDSNHRQFEVLLEAEPKIDLFGYAARLYAKSEATSTVTSYCQGINIFRESIAPKTLAEVIDEMKTHQSANTQTNGEVYKLLADFGTYCRVYRHYGPRSTRAYVGAVRSILEYHEIEIDERKFKNKVNLPKVKKLREEYPPNEIIWKILNTMSLPIRAWTFTMIDGGLEPTDATQLKPKEIRFEENPVRIVIDRQKTGERIETFVNNYTADALKQVISLKKLGPDDYIFITGEYTDAKVKQMRGAYNFAVAKAGFGKITYDPKTRQRQVILDKIDGHRFGKYHCKIHKKRWFSIATSVVDDYVAHGMLGRGAYLDEYMAHPLEKRREFARKILKAVNIYSHAKSEEEKLVEAGEALGIGKLTPEQANKLREVFGLFMKMPQYKLKALLSEESDTET